MRFRTEVNIKPSKEKIGIEDCIFTLGSCFSDEMALKLKTGQIQVFENPFGTLFHPVAIKNALQRIVNQKLYVQSDLAQNGEIYFSWDHYTGFDSENPEKTLSGINNQILQAHAFLKKASWVFITYGTSWVYELLAGNRIVANCHKIPQQQFRKRILTLKEIEEAITETIKTLKEISPKIRILISLSPVRHSKDGMTENQRSKALLLTALYNVVSRCEDCVYLPIYEIMMDDLRDYRFYKEDLIHPNEPAIEYIWEKFSEAYLDDSTRVFISENQKISRALGHHVKDKNSNAYKIFRKNLQEKIELQKTKAKHPIFENALKPQSND